MTDAPLTFVCDDCNHEFPADPECMVEAHFTADHDSEIPGHRPELSPEDREHAKKDMDITDAQLDHMLNGGTVTVGACICKPCQDRMANFS